MLFHLWCFLHSCWVATKLCFCLLLREACETALKEKYEHDVHNSGGLVDHSNSVYPEQLKALGQVIDKAIKDDNPTEVSIV